MSVLAVETTGGPWPQVKRVRRIPRSAAGGGIQHLDVPPFIKSALERSLPPVVRRDPRERYRAMLERISAEALRAYRQAGRPIWPESAWRELKAIAWRTGDPKLTELGGEDQVRRQIEALTRHIVETGERRQRAKDAKKVTLDWHGH